MTRARIELVFIALFAALLLLPAAQWKFDLIEVTPLDEHRRLAPQPEGPMLVKLYESDYAKDFERFFNDSYGLRDWFIRAKNQLDYSVFSRSDEVVIGGDGWLEYQTLAKFETIRVDRMSDADLAQVMSNLETFAAAAQLQGATVVLLPVQTKFAVYPDFAPRSWPHRPPQTIYRRLLARLAERQIPFVDATAVLTAAREKHQVFHKTDFHWNEFGSHAAAGALLELLSKREGLAVRWEAEPKLQRTPGFVGGLNRSLAVFWPPLEDTLTPAPPEGFHGQFIGAEAPFNTHYLADAEGAEGLLPSTLFVGNSYIDGYFRPLGVYERFREARVLHLDSFHLLPPRLPPGVKYVVMEFLEINLDANLQNPAWWPTLSND